MRDELVKTVLLSTKCSAGCKHCPFSTPNIEQLFLNPEKIRKIIDQNNNKLIILSGGEPFEHPEISKILTILSEQSSYVRIATGGFIDLIPWIEKLKCLSQPSGPLLGISMGTDVLSFRVNHSNWVSIWKNNIQLFFQYQIPYSLTLTVGQDLKFTHFNLWRWNDFFSTRPEFIYLRYFKSDELILWRRKIAAAFSGIPIIFDKV